MKGGDSTSTSPPMAADRITTLAGPGLPLVACLIASWVARTASLGLAAMAVYRVKDVRPLPDGVLGRKLGPHHKNCVGLSHNPVRHILAVHAHHAQGQWMGLRDGALSFVTGSDGHFPDLGQLL